MPTINLIKRQALAQARLFERWAGLAVAIEQNLRRFHLAASFKLETPVCFTVLVRHRARKLLLVVAINGLEQQHKQPAIELEVYTRDGNGDLVLVDSVGEERIPGEISNYLNAIRK